MNSKYAPNFLSFLMLAVVAGSVGNTNAYAGGGVSGGADLHVRTAAWFTTDDQKRTVNACFEVSPGFGFTNDRLESFVREAFNKWVAYYDRVSPKIVPAENEEAKRQILSRSPQYWNRIASRLEIHAKCTGNEDLTIYFGNENDLTRARKKKYVAPFAFSELRKPLAPSERQAAWSTGLIWIALPRSVVPKDSVPTWTNYDGVPLRSILLHEIGHVFGNDHVENTIMRSDIADRLAEKSNPKYTKSSPRALNELVNIDSMSGVFVFKMELARHASVRPRAGDCLYTAGEGRKICEANGNFAYSTAFKRLTGRDMSGPYSAVSMTLDKDGSEKLSTEQNQTPFFDPNRYGRLQITLKDNAGEFRLKFTPVSVLASRVVTQSSQFRLPNGNVVYSDSASIFGFLETPAGKKVPMVANYNMDFQEFALIDPMLKVEMSSGRQEGFAGAVGCWPGQSCPLLSLYNYNDQ